MILNLKRKKKQKIFYSLRIPSDRIFRQSLEHNDIICYSETIWREHKDSSFLNVNENYTEFHEPGLKNHLGEGRPGV